MIPWRVRYLQIWWEWRTWKWSYGRGENFTFRMFYDWHLSAGPLRVRKWNWCSRHKDWSKHPETAPWESGRAAQEGEK